MDLDLFRRQVIRQRKTAFVVGTRLLFTHIGDSHLVVGLLVFPLSLQTSTRENIVSSFFVQAMLQSGKTKDGVGRVDTLCTKCFIFGYQVGLNANSCRIHSKF
jgi:hypothetical protein